jgi:hypothetical protein
VSSSSPIELVDAPQPVQTPNVDPRRGFPANTTREEIEIFMDFLEDARTTIHRSWNTTIDVASGSADTSAQPSSLADPSSEGPALAKDSADNMLQ